MLSLMYASKEEIAAADAAYRTGILQAQVRLREHLAATGGPTADGSVPSLIPIGAWFIHHLQNDPDHPLDGWIPAWWEPTKPVAGSDSGRDGPFTGTQLQLIDEVHAYIAEVLMNEIPDAHWVICKGERRDLRNGSTVLQLNRKWQDYPLSLVYSAALDLMLYKRRGIDENHFFDAVLETIANASC